MVLKLNYLLADVLGYVKNSPKRKIAEFVRLQRFFVIINYAAN